MSQYTIQKGDTLISIAKAHGLRSYAAIYDHPDNAGYRQQRPNPHIIKAGDTVFIPPPSQVTLEVMPGARTQFTMPPKDKAMLRLKLAGLSKDKLANARAVFEVDGTEMEGAIDPSGMLECELPTIDTSEANLNLYLDGETVSHEYQLKIGQLLPASEVEGVQARCSALGFDCGEVNGELNEATQNAIKSFQRSRSLGITGVADEQTIKELEKNYGC